MSETSLTDDNQPVPMVDTKKKDDGSYHTSRKMRQKVILSSLIFCAFCVLFIMFKGVDSSLYETIVVSSFSLAGSVIGFMIAGEAWDIKVVKK